MALPQLIAEQVTADAAFVDGSHRFHEVFVDLYFLRKIVRPGGLVVLDDHWWPSVRTAERYFELNMGWRVVPGAFDHGTVDQETGTPAPAGAPPARPSVRTGLRALPAVLRWQGPPAGLAQPSSTKVNEPWRAAPVSRTSVRTSSGWKMPSRSLPGSPGK